MWSLIKKVAVVGFLYLFIAKSKMAQPVRDTFAGFKQSVDKTVNTATKEVKDAGKQFGKGVADFRGVGRE